MVDAHPNRRHLVDLPAADEGPPMMPDRTQLGDRLTIARDDERLPFRDGCDHLGVVVAKVPLGYRPGHGPSVAIDATPSYACWTALARRDRARRQSGVTVQASLPGPAYSRCPMLVSDLTHFLNLGDDVPAPAARLGRHLADVVRAASAAELAGQEWTSALPCRRRPGRQACPGHLAVAGSQPPTPIRWRCDACADEGLISNWEGSPFDLRRRRLTALDTVNEIVVGDEVAATLRELQLLDPDCERLVFGMSAHPQGATLHASDEELEILLDSVAAEANHEPAARRRRRLDTAFDALSAAAHTPAGEVAAESAGSQVVPPPRSAPKDLRRKPRRELAVYRLRVELDDSTPPIWRRIDVRSDLPLDVVHQVLQAAFGWNDYHLYRFSLGGGAFDRESQCFLCPYDVDNKDWDDDDDDGSPAAAVRLDEVMGEPADTLQYVYDYGDNWELTLRLEEILPATAESAVAVVSEGRRAAPPEDCGGLRDAEELAEVLDDPARFDPSEANAALEGLYFTLYQAGFDRRLLNVFLRLEHSRFGADITRRVRLLADGPPPDAAPELYLGAFQWFLDRAAQGGIPLTSAGYLKPADVMAASKVVPEMDDWIGQANREMYCGPLLHFRESMQRMGLLRKHKGVLVLTRAGAAAQLHAGALWDHLATRLIPDGDNAFDVQATLLLLLFAATTEDDALPYEQIVAVLAELGWRHSDGRPPGYGSVFHLPARGVLANVWEGPAGRAARHRVSAGAAGLARAALRAKR